MAYIDEAARRGAQLIHAIDADRNIPAATKKTVQDYVEFMNARGLSERSISKNLYCLSTFLKAIGRKEILKLGKEDVLKAMALVERSKYSEKTKQNIKVTVKSFYKHFLGDDEYYPEQVRWIKTSLPAYKKPLPESILTEDDVLRMIDACENVRDRAIIALLYDSGMRVGELLNLRMKDVDLESEPGHVLVSGKTGMRRIPILFSAPYVSTYLGTLKKAKPGDQFLKAIGSWKNLNVPIDRNAVGRVLKLAAERVGITKKVNPHAFRHARATYYANKLTEQQLKVFFGWTSGSRMAGTYVHLSGRDIDNAVLEASGKRPREESAPKLTEKICPRCRYANGVDSLHCQRCGAPLDTATLMKEEEVENVIMEQIKADPEFKREMLEFLKEKRKEREAKKEE